MDTRLDSVVASLFEEEKIVKLTRFKIFTDTEETCLACIFKMIMFSSSEVLEEFVSFLNLHQTNNKFSSL